MKRADPVMSNELEHLMERNVSEVFGQRDSVRRKAAINESLAAACAFFDEDGETMGRDALNAKAERRLQENPRFVFRATGPADVIHDLGRVRWQFGAPGVPPAVTGVDVGALRTRPNPGSVHLSGRAPSRQERRWRR
jgi:hypothetical protein